jgi:hypothetical protein
VGWSFGGERRVGVVLQGVYVTYGNLGERNITISIQPLGWALYGCPSAAPDRTRLVTDAVKMQFIAALRAAVSHELVVTLQSIPKSL